MKSCSKNRKQIVAMVTGTLPEEEVQYLHTHFQSCPGCFSYWQEMSQLTRRLNAIDDRLPDAQPASSFHSALAHRIDSLRKPTGFANIIEIAQSWWINNRLAHAAILLVVSTTLVFLIFRSRPVDIRHHTPAPEIVGISGNPVKTDSSVSLAGYHQVAESSLDALDELLSRQARNLATAESLRVLTISKTDLAN